MKPDPLLGSEMTAWVSWLSELVDRTWPTRRKAARALRTREDELSRILSGRRMPRREWLDALFQALHAHTGHTATAHDRRQARARYMDALRRFEELEHKQPGKRQDRRPSWREYALRDSVEEASRTEQLIREELSEARGQRQALNEELEELRARWKLARAELERAEQHSRALQMRREQDERQLKAAARLVRELEEQIDARELQRTTMLERIRSQQDSLLEMHAEREEVENELAELKGRYAWRREVEQRLKEQLDPGRRVQVLVGVSAGIWTAVWLLDGFTIQGGFRQQAVTLLTCGIALSLSAAALKLLVVPFFMAVAVPASAAARRSDERRAQMIVSAALFSASTAVRLALSPYVLYLSINVLCHEWLGLPITLQGGVTAVVAVPLMLIGGLLAQLPLIVLSALTVFAWMSTTGRRKEGVVRKIGSLY
ncbi:hypothetical protein [Streptomyces sp. NPDC048825]|uniref:hypothetical protein n=1 Tax=Streptomyces sp. NPDC048825 TaxID=3365592 RepID=UPI00372445E6